MTMATKVRSGALAGFENGPYLEQSDPRAAAAIRSLPWMRDGGPSGGTGGGAGTAVSGPFSP